MNRISPKSETPSPGVVVSLFDYSAEAVRPWAEAGYDCYCFDLLHSGRRKEGRIEFIEADLDPGAPGWDLVDAVMGASTGHCVLFAWPPCEDMTVSGNRHLERKRAADPDFQTRAARRAILSAETAERHGFAYMVENPIGALCRLWRKPDEIWNPYEFGGYLPPEDENPVWPKYIAPRDAYTKKTGAWLGGGFRFPDRKPVEPEILERKTASGRTIRGSRQFMLLGGSSAKTKQIRNLTPRGAARAFFKANALRIGISNEELLS